MKIFRKAEAQRTDSKHTSSDDTSPLPNFKHSTKFATPQPGGGVLQRANFHNTLCFRLFCCFEMPIFRAYGIGDPSSYQGAHPSLGGVSDRANFHAKPCFCLSSFFWCFAMLIFTSFWEVGFFFKKRHLHFLEVPKFCKKMAVPTSWIFWLTGKRRADVGQTSGDVGRRRADVGQTSGTSGTERRANVGQTSGTSGELKVVETGKNHLQWNRGGKIEKKGTCPVMPKIL